MRVSTHKMVYRKETTVHVWSHNSPILHVARTKLTIVQSSECRWFSIDIYVQISFVVDEVSQTNLMVLRHDTECTTVVADHECQWFDSFYFLYPSLSTLSMSLCGWFKRLFNYDWLDLIVFLERLTCYSIALHVSSCWSQSFQNWPREQWPCKQLQELYTWLGAFLLDWIRQRVTADHCDSCLDWLLCVK